MINELLRRRWFLVTVASLFMVLIITAVVLNLNKNNTTPSIQSINSSDTSKDLVEIDYGDSAATLKPELMSEVNKSMYDILSRTTGKKSGFTAEMRTGSYSESVIDNTPVSQLLVDVTSEKRTYLIHDSNGGGGGQNSMYVMCADNSQQKETDWKCQDEAQ